MGIPSAPRTRLTRARPEDSPGVQEIIANTFLARDHVIDEVVLAEVGADWRLTRCATAGRDRGWGEDRHVAVRARPVAANWAEWHMRPREQDALLGWHRNVGRYDSARTVPEPGAMASVVPPREGEILAFHQMSGGRRAILIALCARQDVVDVAVDEWLERRELRYDLAAGIAPPALLPLVRDLVAAQARGRATSTPVRFGTIKLEAALELPMRPGPFFAFPLPAGMLWPSLDPADD